MTHHHASSRCEGRPSTLKGSGARSFGCELATKLPCESRTDRNKDHRIAGLTLSLLRCALFASETPPRSTRRYREACRAVPAERASHRWIRLKSAAALRDVWGWQSQAPQRLVSTGYALPLDPGPPTEPAVVAAPGRAQSWRRRRARRSLASPLDDLLQRCVQVIDSNRSLENNSCPRPFPRIDDAENR